MKTTIDLPDALLHEAKVLAARRRTSLKALVEKGLEHILHGTSSATEASSTEVHDQEFFTVDAFNVPILKQRDATVSEEWIDEVRQEEGI